MASDKNKGQNPGQIQENVQHPAQSMLLNYTLGSQGSQRNNSGIAGIPGRYSTQPGQGGGQRYVQGPLPGRQGGGQQAASNVGQVGAGFSGLYNQAQGGGQKKMPGQPSNMNMMANAQQNYAQQQQQAFAPQGMPQGQTINPPDKINLDKQQPINSGVFDMKNWETQQRLDGNTFLGPNQQQQMVGDYYMNQAFGGAANDFNNAIAPGMPAQIMALAGSQGGMGFGGYDANGRPVGMAGSQVGQTFADQSGLEAGMQGEMRAREAQGLAASQAMDNQYKDQLMRNIESEASSTLANQLPEVGAQMEAAGLGRSGARGLAASQMGQQVLGQANRDKISALSQFADQAAGRSFNAQQNNLQRLGGADNNMLERLGNMGTALTSEQGNRLQNEWGMQNDALQNQLNMFGLNTQNQQTQMTNAGTYGDYLQGINQGNYTGILGAAREGYDDLWALSGAGQRPNPTQQAPQRQSPFVTIGTGFAQGLGNSMFNGGTQDPRI